MKCIACGSEELYGVVNATIVAPLAARGGSIKVGGVKFTQLDIKACWDTTDGTKPRAVKGPISCDACGQEHHYVTGDDNPLRISDGEPS